MKEDQIGADAAKALKACRDEAGQPKPKRLLAKILGEFGGYQGMAKELWFVYQNAEAGSNTQATILRDIVSLLLKCAEEAEDQEFGSIEEIEAELRALTGGDTNASDSGNGRFGN